MGWRAQQPGDFATEFESAFARLQVRLEMACVEGNTWSQRVVAAVRQAVELAIAEPQAANLLTNEALARGAEGFARFERLMTYVARLLESGRAEVQHGADLPASTERSLAGGVATIFANRVDRGRIGELTEIAPEIVQFLLTPYLGAEEARRIAAEADDWPPGQPDL